MVHVCTWPLCANAADPRAAQCCTSVAAPVKASPLEGGAARHAVHPYRMMKRALPSSLVPISCSKAAVQARRMGCLRQRRLKRQAVHDRQP